MKPQPVRSAPAALRGKRSIKALGLSLCLAMAGLTIAGSTALASERMLVEVDRAQLLRLDEPAATVIIGNPIVADASIQDQRTLVITGKSFGSTNLIVLDEEGTEVLTKLLEVRRGAQSVVTMYRGSAQNSYSCSPVCEPTLHAGDSQEYFSAVRDRITSRIETSAGQAGAR